MSTANEIQWRNIKKVVRAAADLSFGGKDDPKYGHCWLAVVNSLTARDGLDITSLGLEPLPALATVQPVQANELLLREMRYIAGISVGQVERVAEQALEAVKQAQPEPNLFEFWWAEYMPDATQEQAFKAWSAVPSSNGVGVGQQVNAMLVEALGQAEKLEHEALVALSEATYELKVGNPYTTATDTYKANNDLIHRLDKILNLQYRDRKHAALAAAQQAQPERCPYCDGTGDVHTPTGEYRGECNCEQAQPERAGLNEAELDLCRRWFNSVQDTNCGYLDKQDYTLAAKIYGLLSMRLPHSIRDVTAQAIKQGGQQ